MTSNEKERYLKLGLAIEKAYEQGAILVYDIRSCACHEKNWNQDDTLEDVLEWLEV